MSHTPGPVETLARLSLQSQRYVEDADYRDAVDAVLGHPVYDASPALLAALQGLVELVPASPRRAAAFAAIRAAKGE